jgi:hypothetical protein
LTIAELDLEKVMNELAPFIEFKEEINVRNVETGVEAIVSKEEFEACKEVLEPIKIACEILSKDDKALEKLANDYCNAEEPKKKRGRPKKIATP